MLKISLILSVLLLSALASIRSNLDDLRILWGAWKEHYDRNYTGGEDDARFAIFVDNYKKILSYNDQNNGVTLTINNFADITLDEFSSYYSGAFLGDLLVYDPYSAYVVDYFGFEIPQTMDWRQVNGVTPVQSQGKCGSSWAWSAIGALEGLNYIMTGKLVPLSVQQLIDCDKGNRGCEGGWYFRALNYTIYSGVEAEADYPYTGIDNRCQYDQSKIMKVNSGLAYVEAKNVNALKASIAVQPVSVAIQSDLLVFQFYSSGVIKSDCGSDVNHAVLAVGYTTINGTEAFILKNSYGQDWGDNGYVYISTDGTANNGNGVCGILYKPVVPTI